jgi:hypothetical protein
MAARKPQRLTSGMSGNGGRAASGMGGAHVQGTHKGRTAPRQKRYAVAATAGERHKGHKFAQARYESLQLGW